MPGCASSVSASSPAFAPLALSRGRAPPSPTVSFSGYRSKIVDPAGRVEDGVFRTEALFDGIPGLLPAHGDAAFQHEVGVLHRARIPAHRYAPWQVDHVHAVPAGWRTALANINQAGEAGIPHRSPLGVSHDMPGELPLARIAALGIEGMSFPRGCAEMARDPRVAVARVADIDWRLRHAAAHADRHQHRLDPALRNPCGRPSWFSTISLGPRRPSSTRKCSTTSWE